MQRAWGRSVLTNRRSLGPCSTEALIVDFVGFDPCTGRAADTASVTSSVAAGVILMLAAADWAWDVWDVGG